MLQQNSVFQRKTVIFYINKAKKIITQFNLNTTILYLKIYIRDTLNSSDFDLYYNSKPIKNNSLPLYKLFNRQNEKSIKFILKNKLKTNNIKTIPKKELNNKSLNNLNNITAPKTNNIDNNNNKNVNNNKNRGVLKVNNESKNLKRDRSLESLLLKQKEEIKLLKKEIEEANNKYLELKTKSEDKENESKRKQLKYIKTTNNFSIISKPQKISKCLSMESFHTMYINNYKTLKNNTGMNSMNYIKINSYYNTNNNTNNNSINNTKIQKERNSFDKIKDLSSIDNINKSNDMNINIFTNENGVSNIMSIVGTDNNINTMNNSQSNINTNLLNQKDYNSYDNKENIFDNNILKENEKFSRNEKAKNKELIHISNYSRNNNSSKSYDNDNYLIKLKEHNVNDLKQIFEVKNKKNENNIIITSQAVKEVKELKEEDKIDFNEIIKKFKLNNDINDNIKKLISKNELFLNKQKINECFVFIFKYLNKEEIQSFSLINKYNGVYSFYFYLNYIQSKINYLNSNYLSLKSYYNELSSKLNTVISKPNIILSHHSKSGLRILNSPHYLNVFNNPIDYFTNKTTYLFIFKTLYTFTAFKFNTDDDNIFMTSALEEIKAKTETKKNIREYIYNLLEKNIEINFDNVMKAKKLMKQYRIDNLEGNMLTSIDRPCTIIGYIVKDILEFTGIIFNNKDKKKKGFGVFVKNDNNKEEDITYKGLKNKILLVCELIENEINIYKNYYIRIEEFIGKYYKK